LRNTVYSILNYITCVVVSVLASSMVDRVFEHRSDQTKDYTIGIRLLPRLAHIIKE